MNDLNEQPHSPPQEFVDVLYDPRSIEWELEIVDISTPAGQKRIDDVLSERKAGGFARRCPREFWDRYCAARAAHGQLQKEFDGFPAYRSHWHAHLSLDGDSVANIPVRPASSHASTPLPL